MRNRQLWIMLVATIAAVAVVGCGGCREAARPDAGAGNSAPPDRGAPDVVLDHDATVPLTDAGTPDAGEGLGACTPPDARPATTGWTCPFVPSGDGGWLRPTCATNPACNLALARDPDAVTPARVWQPCASGRAGCRELVPTWAAAGEQVVLRIVSPGVVVGGVPWFWLNRTRGAAGGYTEQNDIALVPADGADGAAVALRFRDTPRTPCIAGMDTLGRNAAALGVLIQYQQPRLLVVLRGPYHPDPAWSTPAAAFDDTTCGEVLPVQLAASAETVLGLGAAPLYRVDRGDVRATLVTEPRALGAGMMNPLLVDTVALFQSTSFDVPTALWLAPRGAAPSRFAGDPTDAMGLATDGTTLAWLEGTARDVRRDGGVYRDVALYAATYAPDAAAIRPRRVTRLALRGVIAEPSAVAFGRYAFAEAGDVIRVVNLADGTSWQLVAEPGTTWVSRVAWLAADEIALGVRQPRDVPVFAARTIVRLRFDALGPPEPAIP